MLVQVIFFSLLNTNGTTTDLQNESNLSVSIINKNKNKDKLFCDCHLFAEDQIKCLFFYKNRFNTFITWKW